MSALQLAVTQPISNLLFPEEGAHLDGHHSFTVRYTAGESGGASDLASCRSFLHARYERK